MRLKSLFVIIRLGVNGLYKIAIFPCFFIPPRSLQVVYLLRCLASKFCIEQSIFYAHQFAERLILFTLFRAL